MIILIFYNIIFFNLSHGGKGIFYEGYKHILKNILYEKNGCQKGFFMISEELLKIIACPRCKGDLEYISGKEEFLDCHECKLRYLVKDDIPVMLIDQAIKLEN